MESHSRRSHLACSFFLGLTFASASAGAATQLRGPVTHFNGVAAACPRPHFDDQDHKKLKASKRLATAMLRVPSPKRRQEIFDEVLVRAHDHAPTADLLRETLRKSWTLSHRRAGNRSFLRAFGKLVEARQEVDELRSSALALIRDDARYPYPRPAPSASGPAQQSYAITQAEIDKLTNRLRELWETGPVVETPTLLPSHVALIHWTRRAHLRVQAELH